MTKLEALQTLINAFDFNMNEVADTLGEALDGDSEYSALVKIIGEDETEIHEYLTQRPRTEIGSLAKIFADTYELCYVHSSDPEVCGCDV